MIINPLALCTAAAFVLLHILRLCWVHCLVSILNADKQRRSLFISLGGGVAVIVRNTSPNIYTLSLQRINRIIHPIYPRRSSGYHTKFLEKTLPKTEQTLLFAKFCWKDYGKRALLWGPASAQEAY